MALKSMLFQRPLPDNSLAMMPTPEKQLARHPFLKRYVKVSWLNWFAGWELLNQSGYGRELWLGDDVIAALAEWRALWGGAPCVAVPRSTRQHISSSDVYTPEWADALAASIANTTPDETPRQTRPAILPQSLLSEEDIELDAIWAKKAHLDDLIADIEHGLEFQFRKNAFGIILLRDNHWLRWGNSNVYLEDAALVEGIIIQTLVGPEPVTVYKRRDIYDWLKKVEKAKRNPPVVSPPFAQRTSDATSMITGVA